LHTVFNLSHDHHCVLVIKYEQLLICIALCAFSNFVLCYLQEVAMAGLNYAKSHKSSIFLVILITLLMMTLACGSTAPAATVTRRPTVTMAPTPTEYEIAYADAINHKGARVILQGYIATSAIFSCTSQTPTRCYIEFAETTNSDPQMLLSIAVSGAIAPNTMQALPEEFTLSDLLFYDDSSQEVRDGDFVQVTGRIYLTEARYTSGFDAGTPSLNVEKMVLLP
jgi:hypothetical protein